MDRVFIDTNVIKFSATKQLAIIPVNKPTRNWYGKITGYQVATVGYVNPNDNLRDESEIRKEADLLHHIATLAKREHIELYEDTEMMIESMGLPKIGSASRRFYDAPIKRAKPPLIYSRTFIGPSYIGSPDELALDFFKGITDKRFKEIQKVTGAYQGKDYYNLNQLIDAFLIWSAEHNQCNYFLTLDFTLIKMIKNDTKQRVSIKLVRPSELLQILEIKKPNNTISLGRIFRSLRSLLMRR
jgi:hypothetical protein